MNPSTDDLRTEPGDKLDRLLSDYFKSQLKQPWPAAPATPLSEPSSLAAPASPLTGSPRTQPAARDASRRARLTLAASVALLLGTFWFLSNGFQTSQPGTSTNPKGGLLDNGRAGDSDVLKKLREDEAKKKTDPIKLP